MSQAPPPAPQWSPDGRYWWNGSVWVDASKAPASAPPRPAAPVGVRQRRSPLLWVGLVLVVLIVGGVCLAAAGGSHSNHPKPVIDMTGRFSHQSSVGAVDGWTLTVTNKGTDMSQMVVYLNDKDDSLKHHVITDAGGCQLDTSLERLDCGKLAAGETKTIDVFSTPKDAGNFDFEVSVADEEGSDLLYPDKDAFEWQETVTP